MPRCSVYKELRRPAMAGRGRDTKLQAPLARVLPRVLTCRTSSKLRRCSASSGKRAVSCHPTRASNRPAKFPQRTSPIAVGYSKADSPLPASPRFVRLYRTPALNKLQPGSGPAESHPKRSFGGADSNRQPDRHERAWILVALVTAALVTWNLWSSF